MTAPRDYILTLEVRLKNGTFASYPAKLTPKRIMLWHPEAKDTKPRSPGPRGYERERYTRMGYALSSEGDIPYHLQAHDLGPATSPEIRNEIIEVERREMEKVQREREVFDRRGRVETTGKALLAAAAKGAEPVEVLRLANEHRDAVRAAVARAANVDDPGTVSEILDRAYERGPRG